MILSRFDNDKDRSLPSIVITAGVHGDEVGAMILLDALADRMAKSELPVNITLVNYVNPTAIRESKRKSTFADSSDMNRGWKSENFRDELADIVSHHDVLLDLHCSASCTEFLLFNNGQNVNYEWLEDKGITFAVRDGSDDTLKMFASRHCHIGMTWEMKGLNYPDDQAILKSLDIICSKILGDWKNFTANAYECGKEPRKLMPEHMMQAVLPRTDGFIHWRLAGAGLGEKVAFGEELGKIIDINDGTVSEKMLAPCSGTIIYTGPSYAKPYTPACYIQPRIKVGTYI